MQVDYEHFTVMRYLKLYYALVVLHLRETSYRGAHPPRPPQLATSRGYRASILLVAPTLIYPSIYPSIHLSLYPSLHLSIELRPCFPSTYPSIEVRLLFIHLSIYLRSS